MSSKQNGRRKSVMGSHSSPSVRSSSSNPPSSLSSGFASEDDLMNTSGPSPKGRGTRKESEQRRRVMMNQYFEELIALLSMVSERSIPRKMDKATTLKEAVNCIQTYYDLGKHSLSSNEKEVPQEPTATEGGNEAGEHPGYKPAFLTEGEILNFFLDANDTFLVLVTESGRILYSTELITSLLGHMQSRLVGQNIYDYIHEDDKALISDMFETEGRGTGCSLPNSPIVSFPPRNFQAHFKLYSGETSCFPQYLPFTCLSFLRQWSENLVTTNDSESNPSSPEGSDVVSLSGKEHQSCILLLGKLPTSLTLIDLPIGTNDVNFEFEMRISKEGRIIDIDKHAVLVFGYSASELVATSFFDYVDPYHIQEVGEAMSGFLNSGLGTTTPYRIRTKGGRYLWLISKGYLSYNPWNHKPDHVLLSNRVLGCDQVLPEHRFFRSRKLLPDLEGGEMYTPPPLTCRSPSPLPSPTVGIPSLASTRTVVSPTSAQSVMPSPRTQGLQTVAPSHMVSPMQTQVPFSYRQSPQREAKPQQLFQAPPPSQLHEQQDHMPLDPLMSLGNAPSHAQTVHGIQKELNRRNQDLFDLQRQLLEQQKLMERERNQFYQVTQQMMQYMGTPGACGLPVSLQMATNTFPVSQSQMTSSGGVVMGGGIASHGIPTSLGVTQPEVVKQGPPPMTSSLQPRPTMPSVFSTCSSPSIYTHSRSSHNWGVDHLLGLAGGTSGGGGLGGTMGGRGVGKGSFSSLQPPPSPMPPSTLTHGPPSIPYSSQPSPAMSTTSYPSTPVSQPASITSYYDHSPFTPQHHRSTNSLLQTFGAPSTPMTNPQFHRPFMEPQLPAQPFGGPYGHMQLPSVPRGMCTSGAGLDLASGVSMHLPGDDFLFSNPQPSPAVTTSKNFLNSVAGQPVTF